MAEAVHTGNTTVILYKLNDAERASFDELAQSVARTINCTADAQRGTRKQALLSLKKFAEETAADASLSRNVKLALLQHMLKPILKVYTDPTERCRLLAVELVQFLLNTHKPETELYLPYLIPVLTLRLAQKEIVETAEELRALLLQQLEDVITLAKADLGVYIDEVVQMLVRALLDPFPEVKRRGCRCIAILARDVPQQFHMACKPLFQPLLATLSHQHSKVRSVCVKAIGHTVQNGPHDCIDEFRTPLSQKTMDHNPTVRKSLFLVAGRWMLELRDRYSFWHKLLPILLSGETDDVEEIRDLARESFWKAGRLYEKENEERLKDQLDFGVNDGDRLPLGCRELVKENFSKIFPGLLKDLVDWSAATRLQSARLLHTLLRYNEGNVTMHVSKVLEGLRSPVLDDEADVSKLVVACAELIGRHVDPEAWSAALVPLLRDAATPARGRCAALALLGACIRATPKEDLTKHVIPLAEAMSDANVCGSEEKSVLDELLVAVMDFTDNLGGNIEPAQYLLFTAVVHALAVHEELTPEVNMALDKMAAALGQESRHALFRTHGPLILEKLSQEYQNWTLHSHGWRLFRVLALWDGATLGRCLSQTIPIFVGNTHPDRDIELRMRFFTLLGKLLSRSDATLNVQHELPAFAKTIVGDIIRPNLVWLAGDRARTLRTAVISCLWALMNGALIRDEDMDDVIGMILPDPLFTCLEDDSPETRLVGCRVVEALLRKYPTSFTSGFERYDMLHALLPELLKRLDDNDNDVRIATCRALCASTCCMVNNYDRDLYKAHTQALFKGLLIHLDDPNEEIQEEVAAVLEAAVPVNPPELRSAVEAVKHKHRTPKYCQRLLDALDADGKGEA